MTPGRRAVAFDVDGVLLDSTAAHRDVWSQWARSRDLAVAPVLAACTGRRPEDTVRVVAPYLDPAAERLALDVLTRACRVAVRPMPGASELLWPLPTDRWAIVTSGSAWWVAEAFDQHKLPLPAVQVYGEDVAAAKPAPDAYLLAASLLSVEPADCLVVEDSSVGVRAGKAAGCQVLGVGFPAPVRADHWTATLTDAADVVRRWLHGENLPTASA
jgi:mannitol-1-/sugar-/sorbitol-6-phosphatase